MWHEFVQPTQDGPDFGHRPYRLERPGSITYLFRSTKQNGTQSFSVGPPEYHGSVTPAPTSKYTPHTKPTKPTEGEEPDDILIILVRDDVPYSDAKAEIIKYIETSGNEDLPIGEVARNLRLDLDIVIDVFEERGYS